MMKFKSVHIQVDNLMAPSQLLKMGVTKSAFFIDGSKIWRLAATIEWNEILQSEIVTQVK